MHWKAKLAIVLFFVGGLEMLFALEGRSAPAAFVALGPLGVGYWLWKTVRRKVEE